MGYLITFYIIGYLGVMLIIVRNRKLNGWAAYMTLGAYALLWPAIVFGVIPWLLKFLPGTYKSGAYIAYKPAEDS